MLTEILTLHEKTGIRDKWRGWINSSASSFPKAFRGLTKIRGHTISVVIYHCYSRPQWNARQSQRAKPFQWS